MRSQYTYLVELWPFAERSRGIAVFQFLGRGAGSFTTFVNPIGLKNISWRWLITYCCWLAFEICFVWFFFPKTGAGLSRSWRYVSSIIDCRKRFVTDLLL